MANILYWIIIAIVVAEFAFDCVLRYLNIKASKQPIPQELAGIYDEATYKRQQAYSGERRRVSLIGSVLSTCMTLGIFALGGFNLFDQWVRSVSTCPIIMAILFMLIFNIIGMIIDIPFSYYSTFTIETKYGFNRMTKKLFFMDILKSTTISTVITSAIIGVVVWIYGMIPEWFWLIAWAVVSGFQMFMQYIYTDLIVPMFNKLTPMEDGELRRAIEEFAKKTDFKLENIYMQDSSKRSTHGNAYFSGWGKRKKVVIYDTLTEQLTTEQIVAVLAHEIGHQKNGHIVKSSVIGLGLMLLTLWLFSLVIDNKDIAMAAGCSEPSFHINIMVFSMLYTPISMLTGMFMAVMSRRHEWEADEFARKHGQGKDISEALKAMSKHSLANLTPHPLVVFMEYSHPTLLDRVRHLEIEE